MNAECRMGGDSTLHSALCTLHSDLSAMPKLLLCLIATTAVAACLVHLRQQRLDLAHQSSRLHAQLQDRQAKLWAQQVRLAALTAPPAVGRSVTAHGLTLVPVKPIGAPATGWVDARQ
jgi:hypothetical protein